MGIKYLSRIRFWLRGLITASIYVLLITGCSVGPSIQKEVKSLIKEYLTTEKLDARENVLKTLNDKFKELPSTDALVPIIKSTFTYPEVDSLRSLQVKGKATYDHSITVQENDLEYLVYVPEGYQPNKVWPVIFCLHGAGDGARNYIRLWRDTSPHEDKYLLVVPTYTSGYWWEGVGEELVLSILSDIRKRYAVDTNRIYITGFSNGGHGAWYFGSHYPDLLAGIVPAAGVGTIAYLPNLLNLPVYIIHGALDPVIPVESDRRADEELKKLNYDYVYREFPELGHKYPRGENAEVIKWFEKHQRNVSPKKVVFLSNNIKYTRAYWIKITDMKLETKVEKSGTPWLGVQLAPMQKGVRIQKVLKDTPAEKSKLQSGDIIKKADDKEIDSLEQLTSSIRQKGIGDTIKFAIEREDKEEPLDISVTLEERIIETTLGGKITAENKGENMIEISTERIKSFNIYLNDRMVDFTKPIQVWVNGKKVYDETIKPSWDILLKGISSSLDPEMIYTAEIKIEE